MIGSYKFYAHHSAYALLSELLMGRYTLETQQFVCFSHANPGERLGWFLVSSFVFAASFPIAFFDF